MMRTSILAKSLINSRYLVNHKKPAVQLPITKPPKYIYRVRYHPTAPPTTDQGYRDHEHPNDFDDLAMNQQQLFRFKYSGQWWYIGGFLPKLVVIIFPFWLFYMIRSQSQLRKKGGRQGLGSWNPIPEFISDTKIVGLEL